MEKEKLKNLLKDLEFNTNDIMLRGLELVTDYLHKNSINNDFDLLKFITELNSNIMLSGMVRGILESLCKDNNVSDQFLNVFVNIKQSAYATNILISKSCENDESVLKRYIIENFEKVFSTYELIGKEISYKNGKDRIDILAKDKISKKDVVIEVKYPSGKINKQLLRYSKNFINPILIAVNSNDKIKHKDITYQKIELPNEYNSIINNDNNISMGMLIGNILSPIIRNNHKYIFNQQENIIYLIRIMFRKGRVLDVIDIMDICYNAQEKYIKINPRDKYNFDNFILKEDYYV